LIAIEWIRVAFRVIDVCGRTAEIMSFSEFLNHTTASDLGRQHSISKSAAKSMLETAQPIATDASGYIVLSARGLKTIKVPVRTAEQASTIWWLFVKKNELAGSDLKRDSGEIRSNAGELVARVSYNGRVWAPDMRRLLEDLPEGYGLPL
jgi:hypothetical protein